MEINIIIHELYIHLYISFIFLITICICITIEHIIYQLSDRRPHVIPHVT
jgi:hypothetical protein